MATPVLSMPKMSRAQRQCVCVNSVNAGRPLSTVQCPPIDVMNHISPRAVDRVKFYLQRIQFRNANGFMGLILSLAVADFTFIFLILLLLPFSQLCAVLQRRWHGNRTDINLRIAVDGLPYHEITALPSFE